MYGITYSVDTPLVVKCADSNLIYGRGGGNRIASSVSGSGGRCRVVGYPWGAWQEEEQQ